jgi:hypothetical protein
MSKSEEVRLSDQCFSIGELAILVYSRYHADIHGSGDEVEIVGGLSERYDWQADVRRLAYQIQYRNGKRYFATPDQLRRKCPPAHHDSQVTTWEKCLWKPDQVQA